MHTAGTEEVIRLRAELDRLKSFIEDLHDVIYEVDLHGKINYVSSNIEDYLGFSAEDLIGKNFFDFVYPDDKEKMQIAYSDLGLKDHSTLEYRYFHKDGSIRWCRSATKPFYANNKLAGGRGVLVDLTKEKHTESEILQLNAALEATIENRTSELEQANKKLILESEHNKQLQHTIYDQHAKLNQIIEGSKIGTWEWDIKTDKLFFSDLAVENIAFSKEDIADLTMEKMMSLIHPDDINNVKTSLHLLLSGQTTHSQLDIRFVHATEGYIWQSTKAQIVSIDKQGNPELIFGTAIPIQERKQMELALSAAIQEAEKANASKTEFLSRMSHELRTPMNSILGFAQLLELSNLTLSQKKGVTHILQSGKLLLNLINEVLEISRIEAGRLDLSLESVEIHRTITEAVDLVKPMAENRNITIDLSRIADNNLFVFSDLQRTRQILVNLINNAVKYNREGGQIVIYTDIHKRESDNKYSVRISVKDTGCGISEQDKPKLFKAFERIGPNQSKTEGTGLGLAVVNKLVEAMNGILGVESKVGYGSTFWFELPLADEQAVSYDPSVFTDSNQISTDSHTGIVIYIEDNPSNVELVKQVIEMHRPKIALISDPRGLQALPLAKQFVPNLILLDLNLPDIHGKEVISNLKNDPQTRAIPIVVISADAMPHQLEAILNLGAKDYLTKPLDLMKLIGTIDEFV